MIATKKPVASSTVRVAVYARVSVADGLQKEFNSIHAQRAAVEAYVQSQRGSGWVALHERYEDGGYTGANIERPAFQRLLADVKSGKVDVIAVYRIDRLSRSVLDFTQLLDVFERHSVSFVSITERFDTSTPAGRMFINLLAIFAQFERETTAERVRDKVLATRRKGMWTGGRVPLGFDLIQKKLLVNAAEADRVRAIFQMYLDFGSLMSAVYELNSRGWTSKAWTTKSGTHAPGRPFTKTSLHALLTNPLYVGQIWAGSDLAQAQHEAIVDQATWDEVQAALARKASTQRGWTPPRRNSAVLRGLLRCTCGASMIHHSTRRHGRAYRFYVCAKALKHGAGACPGSRAPMGEMDAFVIERVRHVGRDPRVLEATLAADKGADRDELRRALQEFDPLWATLSTSERGRVLALLVEQVTFDAESGEVEIRFRPGGPRLLA